MDSEVMMERVLKGWYERVHRTDTNTHTYDSYLEITHLLPNNYTHIHCGCLNAAIPLVPVVTTYFTSHSTYETRKSQTTTMSTTVTLHRTLAALPPDIPKW
jgi:hypothetical protein